MFSDDDFDPQSVITGFQFQLLNVNTNEIEYLLCGLLRCVLYLIEVDV